MKRRPLQVIAVGLALMLLLTLGIGMALYVNRSPTQIIVPLWANERTPMLAETTSNADITYRVLDEILDEAGAISLVQQGSRQTAFWSSAGATDDQSVVISWGVVVNDVPSFALRFFPQANTPPTTTLAYSEFLNYAPITPTAAVALRQGLTNHDAGQYDEAVYYYNRAASLLDSTPLYLSILMPDDTTRHTLVDATTLERLIASATSSAPLPAQ